LLISCIIPTYKRDHLLASAVSSVLTQEISCARIEIVVVNDSGDSLKKADWQEDPRVTVVTTYHTERCVARNTGAALSRGDYLHFLDDDDMLLPGAYQALLPVADATQAAWTYGAYEIVNNDGECLQTVPPVVRGKVFAIIVAGAAIPMGASLIDRGAFFAVGAFDLDYAAEEDTELLQRISLHGETEMVNQVVARFRVGTQGVSTTKWEHVPELGRLKHEKVFALPCCLSQLGHSLREHEEGYLRGRLVRYYLGSAARHAHSAPLTAISRFGIGCRLSLPSLLSRKFWCSLTGKW
jgi:glycosyltransferase involved in cell wall biosynthesis